MRITIRRAWFYEPARPGHHYASTTVTFSERLSSGTPQLSLGGTVIAHLNLIGDTAERSRDAAPLINAGSTGVGERERRCCITSRTMGLGEWMMVCGHRQHSLLGGIRRSYGGRVGWRLAYGLTASPRMNRAAGLSTAFVALNGYGIDA